jgi:hypothetical protein
MMNERAKTHYDNACIFHGMALEHADQGHVNLAVAYNGLASVATELARFAAENHALVAGIDEDFPDVRQPTSGNSPKLWGGPPQ